MNKIGISELDRFILVVVLIFTMLTSCSHRYTKAFHMEDKFPPHRTMFSLIDNLHEQFDPWIVQVHVRSVFESKDRENIDANTYRCDIYFRLPEDTSVWRINADSQLMYAYDKMFVNDSSENFVLLDSVTITFEPSEVKVMLPVEA